MKRRTRSFSIFSIAAALVILILFFISAKTPEYYAEINSVKIPIEIASDPDSRATGLMFRDSLPYSSGMLFIFPDIRMVNFWMKNTYIPLDIAFIDDSGVIVRIDSMEPHDEARHSSGVPIKYVLEVNKGFFSAKSIKKGDMIIFPDSVNNIKPD